ncbi:ATP-binding protein [uncultured Oscillibacter sp.]|uniref:ATP-binding protein n=1 Tax=uncultured Oscillibacter sp. TaxID=876091 RepID=UPI0025FF98C2|nr:ATP-binding protein [uncultured Oscillibacter sp.]
MAYDGKIARRALQRYEEDRRQRQERFQARREGVYQRQPRLREIDGELRATMSRILSAALRRGADPRPAVDALKRRNLGLQEERRSLLEGMGLPADCLDEAPACPLCGDTGYRDGRMCRCLRDYCAREQQKELSRMLDLGSQSFETFSLEWYDQAEDPALGVSPRENMDWIFRTCRRWAAGFRPEGAGNLLLTGDPGLGKTFLSAAIAREVSGEGFSVVYDTAVHIFERFEARKFGREAGEAVDADVERVLGCDLLILDDLGTEMTTPFVQSALYSIVNGRILGRRPTIVSTNLKLDELARRYGPQTASRLEGEYRVLPFFGEDIRRLKKERS